VAAAAAAVAVAVAAAAAGKKFKCRGEIKKGRMLLTQ
jgi:hypothetical protein